MSLDEEQEIFEIMEIINDTMGEYVAIKGISIGTEIATSIISKFKPDLPSSFKENELVASATSFQYICKSLYTHLAKNSMKSTYLSVEDHIVLMQIIKEVSAAVILDRRLAEMEGIETYQQVLETMLFKISAIIETSEYLREDPLVKIMRAVPSAVYVALISKEGLPIKVIDNGEVQSVMIGSQVAALSNLAQVMMKTPLDYVLIQGKGENILVVQFDSDRILCVSFPQQEKTNIGQYLARIKEIVSQYESTGFDL
jgi:predicted regulator of Ras-like GTPase activity (Roadblock/LC7/MglB family)